MTGCAILDGNIAARKNGKRLPCESLQAENAKLRELVGMIGNVCDGTSEVCKYCKNYSATNDECMMLNQMRELGVEVE